jgi:hypothetical protein
MAEEKAPKFPSYWGPLMRTNFESRKNVKDIRADLEAGFKQHHIEYGDSDRTRCGYACTVVFKGAYLEIDVYIFEKEDGKHVVELRNMRGCRITCGILLDDLAKTLQVEYAGGGKAMPMGPPPLPQEFQIAASKEQQTTAMRFVLDLISDDSPRSMVVQGLRSAGSASLNEDRAWLFAPGELGVRLAFQTAVQFARNEADDEVRIIAMYAISHMARVDGACPSMRSALNSAAMTGVGDANPHVRRLAATCL